MNLSLFDKMYQVFVSSTYEDLIEERQEVMHALLELDCIPAGMELFPAADEDTWTLIKKVIDICDYYIVIIGGRYGSFDQEGMSYTEKEYRYALEKNKPIIAFLHSDPDSLPANKTDIDDEKRKKLKVFRELTRKKTVKFWINAKDLGSVVSRSLIKLIKQNPAIGWVRADRLPEKDMSTEILSLKMKIEELEDELEKERSGPPKGTEKYAGGDKHFTINYSFVEYKSYLDTQGWNSSYRFTWNEIFSVISPAMIDESPESNLKLRINNYLTEKLYDRHKKKFKRIGQFEIEMDSFDSIIVQFNALNLIKKSLKKHTASDTNIYWTLTEYGRHLMLNLRAKKNPDYFEADLPKREKEVMIELQNYIDDWIIELPELSYFKNCYVGKENVIKLSLDGKDIFDLPKSIHNLEHLEELKVRGCNLESFPKEICNIKTLKKIDFYNNQIKVIPEEIGELDNLVSLNLNKNLIEFVPDSIINLKNLEDLSLDFGNLDEFPEIITKIEKLDNLSISGGKFNIIPDSLYSMEKLLYLSINCDEIEEISSLIKNLINLEELEIGGTKILGLPSEIGELINLESLDIYKCSLKKLPQTLLNLEKLTYLFIDKDVYNKISEDDSKIFDKLKEKGCDVIIE